MTSNADNENSELNEEQASFIEDLLKDPSKKQAVLRMVGGRDRGSTPSGTISPDPSHPFPSGTRQAEVRTQDPCQRASGSWPVTPPPWWFPPFFPPPSAWHETRAPPGPSGWEAASTSSGACSEISVRRGKGKRPVSCDEDPETSSEAETHREDAADDDTITLFSEAEALEMVEFDPTVQPDDSPRCDEKISINTSTALSRRRKGEGLSQAIM